MTIGKSNRTKELVKELDEIEYILDNRRLEPIKRRFYEHRYALINKTINNYLNTNNNYEQTTT
jgi:hypothetical protein